MQFWKKLSGWFHQKWTANPAPAQHYVLISDLHLGEDVGEGDAPIVANINASNQSLTSLIHHLIEHSSEQLTLIINGDGIDFLRTVLQPNPVEARLIPVAPLSPREARLGLDTSREHAVWKLGRVLGYHRPVFAALAQFVAAGHKIVVIRGNHDVELYWPEVRSAIVDSLAKLGDLKNEEVEARVRFEPWFFYVPGRLYVEHGHQYDPHCSYLDLLDPIEDEGRSLALPYVSWAIRYFAPLLHGAPAAEMEEWNLLQFLRFALRQPPAKFITAVGAYIHLIFDVTLRKSWRHTVGRPAIRSRHRRRLAKVADRAGLPMHIVERIDALKLAPVSERFWGIALAFYVDRFLLLALASIGFVVSLSLPVTWWAKILGALGVFAVAALLNEGLKHVRNAEAVAPMAARALSIAELLDVPFATFGHSHYADIVAAVEKDGGFPRHFYINSGHWVPSYPHSAGTFLQFDDDDQGLARARVFRWHAQSQQAELIGEASPGHPPRFDASNLVVTPAKKDAVEKLAAQKPTVQKPTAEKLTAEKLSLRQETNQELIFPAHQDKPS